MVWSWELREAKSGKGKWTKPPRQARDPAYNARSNDPSTWGTYDDAVVAVHRGNADGIGYHCSAPASVPSTSTMSSIVKVNRSAGRHNSAAEANRAYQEITVSGAGLRIIGTTTGPETHRKFTFDRKTGAGIELYRNTARYITVSGLETSALRRTSAARPPDRHAAGSARPRPQAQPLDFNLPSASSNMKI